MTQFEKLDLLLRERIGQRLFNDFPTIQEIIIRLSKENPPMGSDCRNVGVEVHYTR